MKSKLLLCLALLFSVNLFSLSTLMAGEPVPGAEIYVELEPDDEPIANVTTNGDGEFIFTFPEGIKIPKNGTFKITISTPQKIKSSTTNKLKKMEMEKQTILIQFNRKDGPKFKFILTKDEKMKAKSNRGGFAVSGRSNS